MASMPSILGAQARFLRREGSWRRCGSSGMLGLAQGGLERRRPPESGKVRVWLCGEDGRGRQRARARGRMRTRSTGLSRSYPSSGALRRTGWSPAIDGHGDGTQVLPAGRRRSFCRKPPGFLGNPAAVQLCSGSTRILAQDPLGFLVTILGGPWLL